MTGAILRLDVSTGCPLPPPHRGWRSRAHPCRSRVHRRRCRPPDRRPGLAWDAVGDQRDEDAVAPSMEKPRTVGELRASGYRVLSVREEMRKNLIEKIRKDEQI